MVRKNIRDDSRRAVTPLDNTRVCEPRREPCFHRFVEAQMSSHCTLEIRRVVVDASKTSNHGQVIPPTLVVRSKGLGDQFVEASTEGIVGCKPAQVLATSRQSSSGLGNQGTSLREIKHSIADGFVLEVLGRAMDETVQVSALNSANRLLAHRVAAHRERNDFVLENRPGGQDKLDRPQRLIRQQLVETTCVLEAMGIINDDNIGASGSQLRYMCLKVLCAPTDEHRLPV